MKKIIGALCVLAGFGVAVPTAASAADVTSNTATGLCTAVLNDNGANVPEFQSPARGTWLNQGSFYRASRGAGSQVLYWQTSFISTKAVNNLSGYIRCRVDEHWRNVFGVGEDRMVLGVWVAYSVASSSTIKANAFGTGTRLGYYDPDNGTADDVFENSTFGYPAGS